MSATAMCSVRLGNGTFPLSARSKQTVGVGKPQLPFERNHMSGVRGRSPPGGAWGLHPHKTLRNEQWLMLFVSMSQT